MKKTYTILAVTTIIALLSVASLFEFSKPTVNASYSDTDWRLTVTGLVLNPLDLTLADLASMPQTSVYASLYCVDAPNIAIVEGNWTGVKLWFLIEKAGVMPSVIKVAFFAKDGYTTDLTLDTAKREDIILAYEKDDAALGETLRLVVPGKWGYKWISQVTSIELVDYDFKGKWESQGYSDDANVQEGGYGTKLPTDLPNVNPQPPSTSNSPPTSTSPTSPNSSNSSSAAPSPPQSPESKSEPPSSEPFSTTWIAAIVLPTAVGAALLVYLKKRRQ
jgi:DMSO/TMAO reductase YedYZ molybdopterin-dependent catalytic subunit